MTTNGDAPSLSERRTAREEWLAERWDGVRQQYSDVPDWLRQLATQLELWLGAELDTARYLEASFVPEPNNAGEMPSARSSSALYLRALTERHFVAVDVTKDSGQVASADVSVFIFSRTCLQSLQATDMTVRGPKPDSVRLMLRYMDEQRPYAIPHADDYLELDEWRAGTALQTFEELREDLWTTPECTGTAIIEIN